MEKLLNLLNWAYDILPQAFLSLVNLSITAGWIVLAVVLIRLVFKKAPKWLNCALWGIVALRLLFPFSIQSALSLIPSTETIDPNTVYSKQFEINTGLAPVDSAVNDYMSGNYYEGVTVPAGLKLGVTNVLAFIWLFGIAVLLIYAFASWERLRHSVRTATKKEGNIYQSEFVSSPFVLGIFKPKIYMPYGVSASDEPLVIAHERAHIKRRDYLIKPLGFLLLCVHWFNPLLWVAYVLLCRDIESACDEKVIKDLGKDERRSYSAALLNASISRRSIAACPLAFGEVGVKERIKGVMNYKQPAFWVIILAVIVCIVTAVCFLTNPKDSTETKYGGAVNVSENLENRISEEIMAYYFKNYDEPAENEFDCQAHRILANEVSGSAKSDIIETETVYLVLSYSRYRLENGELNESGGMNPAAITFEVNDGEYTLLEFWEPGMGADYDDSIKAKFPAGIDWDTVRDYGSEMNEECLAKARQYFGIAEDETAEASTEEHTTHSVTVTPRAEDYSLRVAKSQSSGVTWITDAAFGKKYGYHVFLINLEKVYITVGGKEYYLGDALNQGIATIDALIAKAKSDAQSGNAKSDMYKDGGSMVYWYEDYTVIKLNTLSGERDVYICPAGMGLNDAQKAMQGIEIPSGYLPDETATNTDGVTAPVGYNGSPHLDAKIIKNYGSSILVEAIGDSAGISDGAQVSVGLSSVLSHIPLPDLSEGNTVRIIYDGNNIMETYPLQVNAWAVYELE